MITNKIILGIIIISLIVGTLYSCAASKSKRIVLFEGKTHPWKVEYVKEDNFPAGKSHHYEVFYDGKQLIIPKEIFNSVSDISKFTAANGFETGHNQNQSVLLTIENISKKENGFNQHQFISFFVAKINDGKPATTFWIYNLDKEKTAEFELE